MTAQLMAGEHEPVAEVVEYCRAFDQDGAVVTLASIYGAPEMTTWVPLTELTIVEAA